MQGGLILSGHLINPFGGIVGGGPPGFDGVDGEEGEQGQPGAAGLSGAAGATGAAGAPGAAGSAGPSGPPGIDGEDGEPGGVGPPGTQGPTGAEGATGATGASGIIGPPGIDAEEPEMPYIIPGPQGLAGAAGGGGTATTVEVSFATAPATAFSGRFTITDAAITAVKKVLAWQAPGPYTGKGTLADEAAMDRIDVLGVEPLAGTAIVHWSSVAGYAPRFPLAEGNFLRDIGPLGATAPHQDDPQARVTMAVVGRVRGNFKFSYMVLT